MSSVEVWQFDRDNTFVEAQCNTTMPFNRAFGSENIKLAPSMIYDSWCNVRDQNGPDYGFEEVNNFEIN